MIPGSNILNAALTVIAATPVTYYVNTGRVTNEIGQDVASFAAPITVYGSLQAVPRDKYEYMGLDLQKNYVYFYTSKTVTDLQRDKSGDRFEYNGHLFQCESETDWHFIDGWCSVLCVNITEGL